MALFPSLPVCLGNLVLEKEIQSLQIFWVGIFSGGFSSSDLYGTFPESPELATVGDEIITQGRILFMLGRLAVPKTPERRKLTN